MAQLIFATLYDNWILSKMNLKYKIKSTSFAKTLKTMLTLEQVQTILSFSGWPHEGESKLHIVLAPTKQQQKNRQNNHTKGVVGVKKTNSIVSELPRCFFDNKSRLANTLQGICKLNECAFKWKRNVL
jgi:hypothetical protein